jgi:hypothetical protein
MRRMTRNLVAGAVDGAQAAHVVQLIPGQNSLVLFTGARDELPDDDVIDELRMHAYERAAARDLGTPEVVSDALNVAQMMADGVVGTAAWEGLRATKRFVDRWRARGDAPLTSPESVQEQARLAAQAADAIPDPAAASTPAPAIGPAVQEPTGWTVIIDVPGGGHLRVNLDLSCTVANVQRTEADGSP